MCLGIPMRIVALAGTTATVEVADVRQQCDVSLTPEAAVGRYVIVHAGFAIEVLDEDEAAETLALFRHIGYDVSPPA
jgi:hydrogenase expression/formation protein HypC